MGDEKSGLKWPLNTQGYKNPPLDLVEFSGLVLAIYGLFLNKSEE